MTPNLTILLAICPILSVFALSDWLREHCPAELRARLTQAAAERSLRPLWRAVTP